MVKSLEIGMRVYCSLYGGKNGAICQIHGEQNPGGIRSLGGGAVLMGGSAEVDVVWDNGSVSRYLPEALVRDGVQWRVYWDEPVLPADEVAALLSRAALKEASDKAKADEAKAARLRLQDEARAAGVARGLIPQAEFKGRGRACAHNLRIELKAAGIKARVKVSDSGGVMYVKVADAAQVEAAEDIARQYKAGSFDGMEDLYRYSVSPHGEVFGSIRYVWVEVE